MSRNALPSQDRRPSSSGIFTTASLIRFAPYTETQPFYDDDDTPGRVSTHRRLCQRWQQDALSMVTQRIDWVQARLDEFSAETDQLAEDFVVLADAMAKRQGEKKVSKVYSCCMAVLGLGLWFLTVILVANLAAAIVVIASDHYVYY